MQSIYQLYSDFKKFRNKYLIYYEGATAFLLSSLVIMGVLLLALGFKFLFNGFIVNGHFAFERLRAGLLALVIIMFLIIEIAACFGLIHVKRRGMPIVFVIGFGFCVFFFLALPLLAEGSKLLEIARLDDATIDKYCNASSKKSLQDAPVWTRTIFDIAHVYDDVTERLISDNMCTERCPCLAYNHHKPNENPMLKYEMHLEKYMNVYGRSNFDKPWSRDKGFKPMVWTTNVTQGFKSFMDCYQFWEDAALRNPSIKIENIFKVDKQVYGKVPAYMNITPPRIW